MICKLFKGSFENFTQAIDSFLLVVGVLPLPPQKKTDLTPPGSVYTLWGFPKNISGKNI
tara:strand:- start:367 stop:543 length:177 start_codon:yes stop_codon:yes gene_type:complete